MEAYILSIAARNYIRTNEIFAYIFQELSRMVRDVETKINLVFTLKSKHIYLGLKVYYRNHQKLIRVHKGQLLDNVLFLLCILLFDTVHEK